MPSLRRSYIIPTSPFAAAVSRIREFEFTATGNTVIAREIGSSRPSFPLSISINDVDCLDNAIYSYISQENSIQNIAETYRLPRMIDNLWDRCSRAQYANTPTQEVQQPVRLNPYYTVDFTPQFENRLTQRSNNTEVAQRTPMPKRRHYLVLMPYGSYQKCASCFVIQDLKLMRAVVLRVLQYLSRNNRRPNRSAELWRGYEQSLIRYGIAIAIELRSRGCKDSSLEKLRLQFQDGTFAKPEWVFWPKLQESHQAYLLLRSERRLAKAVIRRYRTRTNNSGSILAFCERNGFDGPRNWHWDIIEYIKRLYGVGEERVPNPYRQQGWLQRPNEDFVYPEVVNA